jgi:hypothetical protein
MWEDWYRAIICEIIKNWGHKCDELDDDIDKRSEQADAIYQTEGPPPIAEGAAMEAFAANLAQLEAALADSRCSLSQANQTLMGSFVTNLREDLGL